MISWVKGGPYHFTSNAGYTISKARVDGDWVYTAWLPRSHPKIPPKSLGYKSSFDEAQILCLNHFTGEMSDE